MTNRSCSRASVLLLFALALLGGPATAAALSVQEAVRTALANNPNHLSAEKGADIAALEIEKAEGLELPALELKGSYTRYSEPMTVHPIHQQGVFPLLDRDVYSGGLYVQMPVYAGGRYRATKELARHQYRASVQQHKLSAQQTIFAVVGYYAEILTLERFVEAAGRRVRFYREEKGKVESMLAKGRRTRLDLAKISTRLSQASYELLRMQDALLGSRLQLAALMHVDADSIRNLTGFELSDEAIPGSLAEALEEAERNHPEMMRFRALMDSSQSRVEIAGSEWYPQVSAVGNAKRMAGGDLNGQNEWQVGLQVSFPLFDGHIRQRNLQQARLEEERAALSMQDAYSRRQVEVTHAFRAVTTAEKGLDASRSAFREAEEALRIESMRLQHGRATVNDMTYAESVFWEALSSLTEAENALLTSRAALLKAVGALDVAHLRPAARESD